VREVLDDDRYRTHAARLASAIDREHRAADLVAELEALARHPMSEHAQVE
jgi:hypothetical protein